MRTINNYPNISRQETLSQRRKRAPDRPCHKILVFDASVVFRHHPTFFETLVSKSKRGTRLFSTPSLFVVDDTKLFSGGVYYRDRLIRPAANFKENRQEAVNTSNHRRAQRRIQSTSSQTNGNELVIEPFYETT